MTERQSIWEYIDSQQETMTQLWKHLVEIESGSGNIEGVKQVAAHLDTYFSAMGLETRKYEFENAGPSLAAWNRPGKLPGIAFIAHMDTVFPKGTFEEPLFRQEGEYVYGPGVYDCKGGIAVATLAIKALMEYGYDKRQLKLILSGDEEVAHGLSKGKGIEVYEAEAKGFGAAFTTESGLLNGDVITQRKGGAVAKIRVYGVSSHAGKDPQKGDSAIREAAAKILAIENLTDYNRTYFNCGKIEGGTGSNVIPDYCEFIVGIRFNSNADYELAIKQLEEICADNMDSRTRAELSIGAGFKAMELTPGTDRLFQLYRQGCQELGYRVPEPIYSAGCSDSAYTTMLGIPTLCGVGVRGADNHSPKERAVASSLCEQAKKIVWTILNME